MCAASVLLLAIVGPAHAARRFPHVLVISVDTLRYDRLSGNGYSRATSPHIDSLMRRGVTFDQARVPEPLTAPSMVSFFTSLDPHQHGATRNGIPMRPNLESWPKILQERGYKTAAFVGNWTLRNEVSGLGEHFEDYEEVLSRKRWGLFLGEANANDLNEDALDWLEEHLQSDDKDWPFFLWVHYVEPHAPYRFHKEFASRLGGVRGDDPSDRYDTEVAYVDKVVGDLLSDVAMRVPSEDLMVVFMSDHGESLGEHGYKGHGRHLYDVTLHIPMSITWPGKLEPRTIDAPASSLDVAPTVLSLLGLKPPEGLAGVDWRPVLWDGADADTSRTTYHQAHKGAVQRRSNTKARRQGLLEVGLATATGKEKLRVKNPNQPEHYVFDLLKDPGENRNTVGRDTSPSHELTLWLASVVEGLNASDELPPPTVDDEKLEQLRALGYID